MGPRTTPVDEGWVEVQKHTFTRWANVFLPSDMAVDDLYEDFKDGLRLIALLERISNKAVCLKYNKIVKYRIHQLENLNHVFGFMAKENVTVTNIGSSDIVDGNTKLVLGLMWTIIKHYQLADISVHGVTGKEGLLLWCKECLQQFPDIVKITNFTSSWSNGLAFCALIYAFHPDLIPLETLSPDRRQENLTLAFTTLEKSFDVPQLLQVEDFEVGVDEKSVLTYLALVFRVFGVLERPVITRTPSMDDTVVTDTDADVSDINEDDEEPCKELDATESPPIYVQGTKLAVPMANPVPMREDGASKIYVPMKTPVVYVHQPIQNGVSSVIVAKTHRFWFLDRSTLEPTVVVRLGRNIAWLRCMVLLYVPLHRSSWTPHHTFTATA